MKKIVRFFKIISIVVFFTCILWFFIYFTYIYDNGSNIAAYREDRINNMIFVSIIAILFFAGVLMKLFDIRKEKTSPYFKIKKKFEADLIQSNLSEDWKLKQEINLQLLWLEIIKEKAILDYNFLGRKEISEDSILSKLTFDEIKYQSNWNLESIYHFPLCQMVITRYSEILKDSSVGLYKSFSILPFSKDVIRKSILFILDYLDYENPLFNIPDKQNLYHRICSVNIFFQMYFVDTSSNNLPKDTFNNIIIGGKLREEQPIKEDEDLYLIDWRNEENWVKRGVDYLENNKVECAIICLDKALELNPVSEQFNVFKKNLYQCLIKYYSKNGKKELELFYIGKLAELGYDPTLEPHEEAFEEIRNKENGTNLTTAQKQAQNGQDLLRILKAKQKAQVKLDSMKSLPKPINSQEGLIKPTKQTDLFGEVEEVSPPEYLSAMDEEIAKEDLKKIAQQAQTRLAELRGVKKPYNER